MTNKKTKTGDCNKRVKFCYNGWYYFVEFDLKGVESSFKYCPENPVKTILAEVRRSKNGKLLHS